MTMTIVDRAYLMKKHRNEHYIIMIKVAIDKEAAILYICTNKGSREHENTGRLTAKGQFHTSSHPEQHHTFFSTAHRNPQFSRHMSQMHRNLKFYIPTSQNLKVDSKFCKHIDNSGGLEAIISGR